MADFRISFLHSAQARHNRFHAFEDTRHWLQDLRANCSATVTRIPLAEMENWYFDGESGDLRHRSGKFFSITGLHCSPAHNPALAWEQPIIVQPEIGILGILTREFDGVRYFLMQAKMEPGNANLVQLSPTVQATFSNYSQTHQGSLPAYVSYFLDPNARTINSQLQSETGTRFYRKFNRNILLDVEEDVELLPGFRWLTLYEILRLAQEDDMVNMDSRSVLSNISYAGAHAVDQASGKGATIFHRSATANADAARTSLADLRDWLRVMRARLVIDTKLMHLNKVSGWRRDDWGIRHASRNYFEVAGVRVQGGGREVAQWCQPLLKHEGLGLSGFICAEINGVLHFLMQAKPEPGIVGSVEIGPTVSVFDYTARASVSEYGANVPYFDLLMRAPESAVLHASIQSEEGGRFWLLRNQLRVVQLPEADAIEANENFAWMTLAQLRHLSQGTYGDQAEGLVNSEARTLLACLPLYD